MNTPAHVVVGAIACQVTKYPERTWPVVVGSILPDLPMYVFYGVERGLGASEREIWSSRYFVTEWQLFFDWLNSLPLAVVVLAISAWLGSRWGFYLAMGMLLHGVVDLPLHHDDGHRHFLPFTHWRYQSPVSYWEPSRYGLIVAPLEMLMTLCGAVFLVWPGRPRPSRIVGGTILAIYAMALGLVLVIWLR